MITVLIPLIKCEHDKKFDVSEDDRESVDQDVSDIHAIFLQREFYIHNIDIVLSTLLIYDSGRIYFI